MSELFGISGHHVLIAVVGSVLGRALFRKHYWGARMGFLGMLFASILFPQELSLAFYSRGVLGDFSLASWFFFVRWSLVNCYGKFLWRRGETRVWCVLLIVLGALIYPASFGFDFPDFYRLGYMSTGLVIAVISGVLVAFFWKKNEIALWLACSLLAYSLDLLDSTNLWDFVLDGFSFVAAVILFFRTFLSKQIATHERISSNPPNSCS